MEHCDIDLVVHMCTCSREQFKAMASKLSAEAAAEMKTTRRQYKQQIRNRKTAALYRVNAAAVDAVMGFNLDC